MKKKSFLIFYPVSMLAVLFFTFVSMAGCQKEDGKKAEQQKPPLVEVAQAKKGKISRVIPLTGEVVSVNTVVISSRLDGPVGYCPWREGDVAEKGQKLVVIDRELYQAEVKSAEAALEVAKARLEDVKAGTRPEEIEKAKESVKQSQERVSLTKKELDRISKLVEKGSLPVENLEKAQTEHVSEQARLASAKSHLEMLEAGYTKTAIAVQEALVKEAAAKLELARVRAAECLILAPFKGVITKVYVRPGDMASSNMASAKSLLLEMVDMSSLVVRCNVPETNAAEISVKMPALVRIDALPQKNFGGSVSRIYPQLDNQTRTRTTEVTLSDSSLLFPGMFARLTLVLESISDATVIPQQALLIGQDESPFAYTVVEGKASRRKVTLGIQEKEIVQVVEGIQAGETVVISGHEKLKDKSPVRTPGEKKGTGGTPHGPSKKGERP